jgi:hypothetical protein
MPYISGIDALVDGVKRLSRWRIAYTLNSPKWVASGVPQAYTHGAGNQNWWGIIEGKGGECGLYPGTQFAFKGLGDATNGAEGTARCHRLLIRADREKNTIVNYKAWFRSDGALTIGATTATDGAGDLPADAVDAALHFDDVDQTGMLWTELEILNYLRPYYSGTGGQIQHDRGNQVVTLRYGVHFDDPADLPALDGDHSVKLYTSAAKFWQVNWLKVIQLPDIDFPREEESAGTRMATGQVEMGLVAASSSTLTGTIIDPAGATQWPFT